QRVPQRCDRADHVDSSPYGEVSGLRREMSSADWAELENQRMSALGQKQTFAPQKVMSALPPKADMCSATRHVRYGPKADIAALIQSLHRRVRVATMVSLDQALSRC